jgi:hypothetical protein
MNNIKPLLATINSDWAYPAVKASALPTANLDFIGLNFGAIFETKPAPALAVGIQGRF